MPPQALAAAATLLSFAPHGNRVEFRLDHGSAELLWMTPSTFRFRRTLNGPLPELRAKEPRPVKTQIDDAPGRVALRSKFLEVSIQKNGILLRVRRADGLPLMADVSEARATGEGVLWERQLPPGARFYGLGPRVESELELRGKTVTTQVPMLISTAGYGEYHAGAGAYRFDFSEADQYRIEAPEIDYYFYYGPTAKQIFEEHKELSNAAGSWTAAPEGAGSWTALRGTLLALVNGAMSAMLMPSIALRQYQGAPEELSARARQIESLVDDVSPGPLGLSDFRKQLETFYGTYGAELHDKGFPVWHPLPFQFPDDPECARHADEFMLGDEMLVAPIYEPGRKRQVYLPQGIWTRLENNEVIPGRRTITVETKALPVFARNGTIVPLDSEGGMALHYFPKLAAEFFLLENDPADWTQVHAAPAGDIMRLEIEAKKGKDYQWVVHHIERPSEVSFEERRYRQMGSAGELQAGTWFYDAAQKNLNVRAHVAAGEDCVINLIFP